MPTPPVVDDRDALLPALTDALRRHNRDGGEPFVLQASEGWIRVVPGHDETPEQGWKLHVSASAATAPLVLERTLPVLLRAGVKFKVVGSLVQLDGLNLGEGGRTQVGKFITIYPPTDAAAVALVEPLVAATAGLTGPRVPTDRPVREGSLVSYRYGGFGDLLVQCSTSEVVPAIREPDGRLVPDVRAAGFVAPAWAGDPFVAAGLADPIADDRPTLIGGRYRPLLDVGESHRATVSLALDFEGLRRCILKRTTGPGGRARLGHEKRVLELLAGDGRFPAPYDLIEERDEVTLVMEDVAGSTLEVEVERRTVDGRLLDDRTIARLGRAIAEGLEVVHRRGIVWRDLKSANVIIEAAEGIRLLDFELAWLLDGSGPLIGVGTPGYMSPAQRAGEKPTPADDIYALGAILYLLATGAEPSQAPERGNLLDRPIATLAPGIDPAIGRIVRRCLAPDPARRYRSAGAVARALGRVERRSVEGPGPAGAEAPGMRPLDPPLGGEGAPRRLRARRTTAMALADTIVADSVRVPNGRLWHSTHDGTKVVRDVNVGVAGTLIGLAAAVEAFGLRRHRRALAEGASWLAAAPPFPGDPVPGLYGGELGVAVALGRVGSVLGDRSFVTLALDRALEASRVPHGSPDLFVGSAGRARAHLYLARLSGDTRQLAAATAAGLALLDGAETVADGLRWPIPPGYGRMSGLVYLGYAHGVAGISDVLLELWAATGDARFREAAVGGLALLVRRARPALVDGSGLNWTSHDEGGPRAALWCHGGAGVGRAFLRAAALGVLPEAATIAERAARTVARGSRAVSPVRCHGLAGTVEFLVDTAQAGGADWALAEARSHGLLLDAFVRRRADGHLVVPSDSPRIVSPDYMVGYAGVIPALLRLLEPERTVDLSL